MFIKDGLYNYFVRRNGRVWYEYERYVREHMDEYKSNRKKRLSILIKLNWFYRIKKGNTPYLYWDTPLDPNQKTIIIPKGVDKKKVESTVNIQNKKTKNSPNPWTYPEMSIEKRKSVDEMVEILARYDVISFDVFDTLIFRYVSNPRDVFNVIGNKLGIYDFASTRVRAEIDARNNTENKCNEVNLSEIYDYVSRYLGIDKKFSMDMELEVEKSICFANPYMQEIVRGLVSKGKQIIATSNMYLNSLQINEILTNCGYSIENVYSSCDIGLSKYKGQLQEYIWNKIGKEKKVIHVGDNYISDYVGSRMIGWKAYYYKNVNEVGKNHRPAKMSKLVGSVYNGIVNSKFHSGDIDESLYYELGFGYLGILIVGYCRWINEYAQKHNINKLLFSSRDMCLVYKMYTKYYKKIDCDYIKISRFAAQRFSYNRFSDYYIDSHIKARALIKKLEIREVLRELDIEFMEKYISEYDLKVDDIFSMDNFERFRSCLNDYKSIMLANFQNEKEASIKYYSQFVNQSDRVGVVDLGWQGTNGLCLKYLLEEEMNLDLKVKSLLMVSWGTREFVSNSFDDEVADVYCFSARKNEQLCGQFSPTKMGRFICELLFSSNEKSLKNIHLNDKGDFEFTYIQNEKRNEKCISDIYRGAEDFVEMWEKSGVFKGAIDGFDAILPLNKISYSDICFEIMEGNEINPWIGETRDSAASSIKKLVR